MPGTNGVLGQGAEEQKGETARLVTLKLPSALQRDCVAVLFHRPYDQGSAVDLQSVNRSEHDVVT